MTSLRGALRHGWTWVALFLLTRAVMVAVWRYHVSYIVGDVGYYFTKTQALPQEGIEKTMLEYPTPVVWGLAALGWLGPTFVQYVYVFALAMLALDAGFMWLLWHHGGPRRRWAASYWLAFVPLLGPLMYMRFDLLPAVLAGAGLLWLWRRPRLAGGLVGLGAATKLWPALLVVPMLAPRRPRGRVAAGFVAVGFGLAAVSLVLAGPARLVSPLTWQKDRGLQVESLVAAPLMALRTFAGRNEWLVYLSNFNAFEVSGPGRDAMIQVSTALTVVGMVVIGLLCWRLHRTSAHPDAVGLVVLAIVAIMIVTNKTLSPQYVVWLAGPLAVLVGGGGGDTDVGASPVRRVDLTWLALGALPLAALTQWVYPFLYDALVQTTRGTPLSTVVLILRNALLLAWTVWLCLVAWRATRVRRGERATPRNPLPPAAASR